MIKVRWQGFWSIDDRHIIALMEMGGFHKLGPSSKSLFISSFSLFCSVSLLTSRSLLTSKQVDRLNTYCIKMSKYIHAHGHFPQYFHRRHMMTQLFTNMHICYGLELLGDFVWFRIYTHFWVSCSIFAQDKQKVCASITFTCQIPRIISRYDRDVVYVHDNAAMTRNSQE